LALLAQAGYDLDGTVLRQRATRTPLTFEILVTTRDQERIALAFQRDLKRAGIEAAVRAVDGVQFDQRRLAFDFDMIQNRWDQLPGASSHHRRLHLPKRQGFQKAVWQGLLLMRL
jgi:peptide/nickel transport system substrate-binding protein